MFLNAREIEAILSAPPFALNTASKPTVIATDPNTIEIIGAGEYVIDVVNLLTDKKSKWAKYFAKRKVKFKKIKEFKRGSTMGVELNIS